MQYISGLSTHLHDLTRVDRYEDAVYAQFVALNQRIDKFYASISPLVPGARHLDATRALLVVHSLTLGATINLNLGYGQQDSSWSAKCVNAALYTVSILDDLDLESLCYLNPIMGVSPPFIHCLDPLLTVSFRTYG